jgi:hypothetical protein
MIERARHAGVPFAWFVADEEFGQNPGLRTYLEENNIPYVMAVPKSTEFTDATARAETIDKASGRVKPNNWQRRSCGIGTKGFRVYDWAVLTSDQPGHQYMIRRSVDDHELAFYHCYNPRGEGFPQLVRAAGTRPCRNALPVGRPSARPDSPAHNRSQTCR